ncbi:Chemotaxis protein CheC -- inhibitor of MCP methylation [Paraburkholderia caribensis MBA4]|uniref:Chemotaxis protein CheC--inhibitor of MCP methylation n=2 Tax=Paraburkholderia caribensis TaxID=75105 RepID=A0A0P0RHU6_9BURK|nr:Chemotaxis protein CheC -- inhibitor of MCP methylation [Paraburkholderia caribensis MBA4]
MRARCSGCTPRAQHPPPGAPVAAPDGVSIVRADRFGFMLRRCCVALLREWRLKFARAAPLTRKNLLRFQPAAMSLPIVIADDSLLARKVLTKALPEGWDVDITYASNGREALEHYRKGRASVMFLDLTMPDMTGYQVLEALQHEDLNTFVIVVSADVQPMARERVRALGAIAFVPKPVTTEAVLPILKEYGLYV